MPHTRMTPNDIQAALDRILPLVEKPARYIGGEFNTTLKPDAEVELRVALAFPDIYDIGMSYHGFKIFYERVNREPGCQAERVFAPWDDMEARMREQGVPLYLLESKRPLSDADVIGFTLQHEMNYANILNMLDLGGVPLHAQDRTMDDPIVIAGGHGSFNPEPLADFIDAFVIGDGEWALLQIMEAVKTQRMARRGALAAAGAPANANVEPWHYRGDGTRAKRRAVPTFGNEDMAMPGPWKETSGDTEAAWVNDREEFLARLAQIPGVYVPAFYAVEYAEDGTIAAVRHTREDVPPTVGKINFDVRDDFGAVRPPVPLMRVVHDRFAIEIKRGCMVGCRFCQAGMITRPVRERSPMQILDIARAGIANTGYDEISLLSLSSADYSQILELTRALRNELADQHVSVSLPSLRINAFDVDLADEIGSVRKSGFTFAPEAGTARLREVINKAVDEQRFHETIEAVLAKGWRTLKFYFMCGLPTETDEDLQGIVDLTEAAIQLGKKHCGNNFRLNISLSPFIPKPQTPFQWHAQPTHEEFERKYRYVESRINRKFVSLKKHSTKESVIEGVLSRGDRRLGLAIEHAWRLGCKFDNWHEHLKFGTWMQAFAEAGIDPNFYASRERGKDEVLPWDHIEASLGKRFLWKEKTKSEQVRVTGDCSLTHCAGCNVCDFKEVENLLSVREDGEYYAPPPRDAEPLPLEAVQRVRFTFSRAGNLRFLSHLDMVKVMQLIFRRCRLRVAYTQGFNPQPQLQFAPPLPLGFASEAEPLDVFFSEKYDPAALPALLSTVQLEGLRWRSAAEVPLRGSSLSAAIESASFLLTPFAGEGVFDSAQIGAAIAQFEGAESLEWSYVDRQRKRTRDLRQSVSSLRLEGNGSGERLAVTVSMRENEYINPVTATEVILGRELRSRVHVTRQAVHFAATAPQP